MKNRRQFCSALLLPAVWLSASSALGQSDPVPAPASAASSAVTAPASSPPQQAYPPAPTYPQQQAYPPPPGYPQQQQVYPPPPGYPQQPQAYPPPTYVEQSPAPAAPSTVPVATGAEPVSREQPLAVDRQDEGPRFGAQGQFALGAERLFGVSWDSETVTVPTNSGFGGDSDVTASSTNVNILTSPLMGQRSSYNFSRVAGDYFVIKGLSLGASLGYFTSSGSLDPESGSSVDTGTTSGFLIAPRLGYAHLFGRVVGLWARAGITFVSGSSEDGAGDDVGSDSRLAASLDLPLVLTPAPHAALLLGPSLDYGLSGTTERGTDEADVASLSVALNAGMLLYF